MENEKCLIIAAERDWRDFAAGVIDPGSPAVGRGDWGPGRLRHHRRRPVVCLARASLFQETRRRLQALN